MEDGEGRRAARARERNGTEALTRRTVSNGSGRLCGWPESHALEPLAWHQDTAWMDAHWPRLVIFEISKAAPARAQPA